MKKKLLLTALTFALLTSIQTAQARDPQVVADNCVNKVTALSQKFATTMQAKADTAATKITALLANGNVTSAERLATRTVTSIQRIKNRGLKRVNSIADPCFFKLADAGEIELAEQVLAAWGTALDLINDSADQALATVNAALNGPSE